MATIDANITSPTYNANFGLAAFNDRMVELSWVKDTSGWNVLTDEQKVNAIVSAAIYTNGMDWDGTRSALIVAPKMAWPRSGLQYKTGDAVDDTTNPSELLSFQCCWILTSLATGGTSGGGSVVSGEVKRRTVGPITEEFTTSADGGSTTTRTTSDDPFETCKALVSQWFSSAALSVGGIGSALLTRT